MCLAVIAFQALTDWPIVIVANRDEFHARPTLSAQPWPENPLVLGGKDLAAGGSWFGVTQAGQIALLTNYREPMVAKQTSTSRGKLVTDYLMHTQKPLPYLEILKDQAHLFSGFNLLVGDRSGLFVASNRLLQESAPQHIAILDQKYLSELSENDLIKGHLNQNAFMNPVSAGVWGLSNAYWNTPWPKLTLTRDAVSVYLQQCETQLKQPVTVELIQIMQNTVPVPDDLLPQTGLPLERERQLATPFIVGQDYGTRCTTVLMQHRDGQILFQEQSYAPGSINPTQTVSWQYSPLQPRLGWQTIAEGNFV
jgi:uncharacterized protein with NRDE domain